MAPGRKLYAHIRPITHPPSFRRHPFAVGEIQMDHEHDSHHLDPVERTSAQSNNPVCYHQSCPVCGRNLRIRVMLLGRRVYCQHCGGGFIASDTAAGIDLPRKADRPQSAIVDELIERAAVMLARGSE